MKLEEIKKLIRKHDNNIYPEDKSSNTLENISKEIYNLHLQDKIELLKKASEWSSYDIFLTIKDLEKQLR